MNDTIRFNMLQKRGGFLGGSDSKESACNAVDPGLIPGLGRSPWRMEWLPTSVFWPGEFHGLQSMGLQRVRHDCVTFTFTLCQKQDWRGYFLLGGYIIYSFPSYHTSIFCLFIYHHHFSLATHVYEGKELAINTAVFSVFDIIQIIFIP